MPLWLEWIIWFGHLVAVWHHCRKCKMKVIWTQKAGVNYKDCLECRKKVENTGGVKKCWKATLVVRIKPQVKDGKLIWVMGWCLQKSGVRNKEWRTKGDFFLQIKALCRWHKKTSVYFRKPEAASWEERTIISPGKTRGFHHIKVLTQTYRG